MTGKHNEEAYENKNLKTCILTLLNSTLSLLAAPPKSFYSRIRPYSPSFNDVRLYVRFSFFLIIYEPTKCIIQPIAYSHAICNNFFSTLFFVIFVLISFLNFIFILLFILSCNLLYVCALHVCAWSGHDAILQQFGLYNQQKHILCKLYTASILHMEDRPICCFRFRFVCVFICPQ